MNDFRTIGVPLPPGKVTTILREASAEAGTRTVIFPIDSDSVLISLFVASIASGTLTVVVDTQTEEGRDVRVITFPTITGPTVDLLMRKAALAMGVIRVTVTTTGIAGFEVRAKGISAGESSVKIQGAADWQVSQTTIPASATLVLAADLTDRNGLVIKNNNASGILYVAEIAAKAVAGIGYPLGPGESLGFDLAAGQEIWGAASVGTIDVRIAEAGA